MYNLPKTKYRRLAPGQSGPKRPEAKAEHSLGRSRIDQA